MTVALRRFGSRVDVSCGPVVGVTLTTVGGAVDQRITAKKGGK